MADNETQNNGSNGSQGENTPINPMKAVNTSPLPVKHEFSSDQNAKNAEKRDGNK